MQINFSLKAVLRSSLSLIATIAAVAMTSANAVEPIVKCEPKSGYVFMFINGVWNGPEAAAVSMNTMARSIVGVGLRKGSPVEFVLGYNPKNWGGIGDLLETLATKSSELGLNSVPVKAWALAGGGVPLFAMTDAQRVEVFKAYGEFETKLAADAVDHASVDMPDLQKIITQARAIDINKSLILVGHSEGTIFANLVYVALKGGATPREDNSMRLVAIGAAVKDVLGLLKTEIPEGEPWVTNRDDYVINRLRQIIPEAEILGGNFDGPAYDPFAPLTTQAFVFFGHHLNEIYLNPDYKFKGEIKKRIDLAFTKVKEPTDISACKLILNVNGSQPGWAVFPEVTLDGLTPMSQPQFNLLGTPGNTCGGERGFPPYSLDSELAIYPAAKFYGAPLVTGAPYPIGRAPNRRPCSSFVAITLVPDPLGAQSPKYRIWANATARAWSISGGSIFDTEAQLRYDSGDPWTHDGARCVAGSLAGADFFGLTWEPTSCISTLAAS